MSTTSKEFQTERKADRDSLLREMAAIRDKVARGRGTWRHWKRLRELKLLLAEVEHQEEKPKAHAD